MATLIYSAITSLDGYVEDRDGGFEAANRPFNPQRHSGSLEVIQETHTYAGSVRRPSRGPNAASASASEPRDRT